jgi:hypothetical protein
VERKVRKNRPLKVSENVYWISAGAAARYARDEGKGVKAWRRARLPQGLRAVPCALLVAQAKGVALEVAVELEGFVQTRFLQAIGFALAGGMLSGSMFSLV